MSKDKKLNNNLYKTTERILRNYRSLSSNIEVQKGEIEDRELELDELYKELNDYDRDCVGGGSGGFTNSISNITEKKILRKEKLKTELIPNKKVDIEKRLNKLKRDEKRLKNINDSIKNLDARTKKVIELFYLRKVKMSTICEKVYLEESQCHKVKSNGVKSIRNYIFGFDALEEEDNLISMLK